MKYNHWVVAALAKKRIIIFTFAQAPKMPAGSVRKNHSAPSKRGGGETGIWRPPPGTFLKTRAKTLRFQGVFVLEVIKLKQVKIYLNFFSVAFKIMCDVMLDT